MTIIWNLYEIIWRLWFWQTKCSAREVNTILFLVQLQRHTSQFYETAQIWTSLVVQFRRRCKFFKYQLFLIASTKSGLIRKKIYVPIFVRRKSVCRPRIVRFHRWGVFWSSVREHFLWSFATKVLTFSQTNDQLQSWFNLTNS